MLFIDLIYSQVSQPIAQHFLNLETRMRIELIKNGVAVRCLNHFSHLVQLRRIKGSNLHHFYMDLFSKQAQQTNICLLSFFFAEEVGIEPTRVVISEQFSRLWPPPIGLLFRINNLHKKSISVRRCFYNNYAFCIVILINILQFLHTNPHNYKNIVS